MIDEQFLETIPQYGIGGFVGKIYLVALLEQVLVLVLEVLLLVNQLKNLLKMQL